MAVSRAKQFAIDARRQQVAELYLKGWSQLEIARHLEVVQATISGDVQTLLQNWRESALCDTDALLATELQKLDRLEREAWEAWSRSQKPHQSAEMVGDQERPSRKRIRNQYGDPRFLNVIQNCIASRRALLGLDVLASRSPGGAAPVLRPEARLTLDQLTLEEVQQLRDLQRRVEERQSRLITLDAPTEP